MRRDVRRHTDGDTRGTIDEQIWKFGRQHLGLKCFVVIGRYEIYRLLVDIAEHLFGDRREFRFGVAHGRSRIAVNEP